MRQPDFEMDGWCLEDAEERHAENPTTFWIPELALRRILQPCDFAKLVFKIAVDEDDEPEAFERMWVIVRARNGDGYVGMLDNEPATIEENDAFWRGCEFPFEPRHVIEVRHANEQSLALAREPAPIPWR